MLRGRDRLPDQDREIRICNYGERLLVVDGEAAGGRQELAEKLPGNGGDEAGEEQLDEGGGVVDGQIARDASLGGAGEGGEFGDEAREWGQGTGRGAVKKKSIQLLTKEKTIFFKKLEVLTL